MNTKPIAHELRADDIAPDFNLPATGGKHIHLSGMRGRPVVLFFYPQDGSETCTSQAQAFSQAARNFDAAGVALFGLSPDSIKRHEAFKAKYALDLDLLSDDGRSAIAAYGLWIEKVNFGHVHMGVDRSTFLIGPDGRIIALWRKVRLKGHVDAVLQHVNSLPTKRA